MADASTRHQRGLLVVIGLAALFFFLLAMILIRSGKKEEQVAGVNETLTVLPMRIRIRTLPHARAPVVATATSGERLTVIENRGGWVQVRTVDNLKGWAERANLERTAELARRVKRYKAIQQLPPLKGIATERAQLYSGPGIFYPLVGDLARGSDVVVYTRDHDFYAVQHGESVAYASVDSIDVSSSGTRQLEVRTTDTAATETTATQPAVADTTPLEPLPVPEPVVPEPAPAPVETSQVYPVVPAGGTPPEEIHRVVPRYPGAARRAGVQGRVVVRGIVRRDGTIDNVEIIRDLPYGLGEEARRAVSRWRFRPAMYRGEPIDVYYTVTVNFSLQ